MLSRSLLITTALAVYPTLIKSAPYLEQRDGGVCQSGIYGDLVPWLIDFQPAQIFCTDVYPVRCTVQAAKRSVVTSSTTSKKTYTTTTVKATTSCTTKDKASSSSTTTAELSTTTSKATTSTGHAKSSAWSKCQQQPWNVVSTLCSCIEQPKPCAMTTSRVSSTTTKQTTSSKMTTTTSSTSSTSRSTTSSSTMSTISTVTTSSSTTSTSSSSTMSSTASSTTSSTSSPTTTSSSPITSTTTSSTSADSDSLPTTDCTQLAPASTGVYVASNLDSFYLECGKYYQEDDTDQYANSLNGDGGTTHVDNFKGCLDLCSTTAGCNYISFYEQSILCFLLSNLDTNPNVASGGTYDGYDRAALQVAT